MAHRSSPPSAGAHSGLHHDVLEWYDHHQRPLPWREPGTSAWAVLLSEVMSQQTPVARVIEPWRRWLRLWPTPADLAAASPAEVLREWGSLGYPRRALRLRETAIAVLQRHDGVIPSSIEDLRALPGIGEYSAAAVAVFAFQRRHPVVDVNVRRVLARAVGGLAEPAPSLNVAEKALAAEVLPLDPTMAPRWSVAVMELGALICTARRPRCERCPVSSRCAWQRAGRPPHDGPPRRGQAWEGTDRQARGRVMAVLRRQAGAGAEELAAIWPDPVQRGRVIASLIRDGLAEHGADGRLRLPGADSVEPGR